MRRIDQRFQPKSHLEFVNPGPLGGCGEPEETANGICFLTSDEVFYISSSELPIDGGVYAGSIGRTIPERE